MDIYTCFCVKCLFDYTVALVNRIEYDRLGNIRNEETEPQIDIHFKKGFYVKDYRALHRRGARVYSPKKGSICRVMVDREEDQQAQMNLT